MSNRQTQALAESTYQQAHALHQQGRFDQAGLLYQQALRLHPLHGNSLHQLGVIALQTNRPDIAVALISQAIKANLASAVTYVNYGNALYLLNRLEAAIASYDQAIALEPDSAAAYNNRGAALRALNRQTAAIASYEQAIALKPDYADAYNNRGLALYDLRQYGAAIASYERAIAIKSDHADAHGNRGVAQSALGRYEEALASYDRAIALKPEHADTYNNRGVALVALHRLDAAMASYDQAIVFKPGHADAHMNRGNALREMKRYEAALASYDRAIALKPDHAHAHNGRGIALGFMKRLDEAVASYDKALALKADFADAYNNRGIALHESRQYEDAITSYDRAILLNAAHVDAYCNRGHLLRALQRYPAAIASYDRALALAPEMGHLRAMRLHTKLRICDWQGFEEECAELVARIERGAAAENPLCLLALCSSAALQRGVAERWVRDEYPPDPALPVLGKTAQHAKIRIGYFSADFRQHAVSILTARLFELHDRSRFELTAFSLGPDTQDEMRQRIEQAFERFIDVRTQSDQQIALLARSLEIDIAVDLGGYTQDCRPGIFAARAAPLQVSYLGYPGTMGAPYMDYLIADPTLIPEPSRSHYSEQIIYMPDSYMVNDSQRCIGEQVFTREELALPPTGIVFCCFNNSYKITPATFDSWMRILHRVEDSVLWLSEGPAQAAQNLRAAAAQRGVNPERLIFAPRLAAFPEHLARHRAADLFLDTLPYNAHTTASDALWAGLPVLTCVGEAFASRVAASLLNSLRLPELITPEPQHYEELAIDLATQPERLAAIRQKLADQRLSTPLFDTALFAQHLEAAYTQIYERYHTDQPAASIYPGSDYPGSD